MNYLDMLSYFMTLIAISLAPGPVVLMLMVRAASNDVAGAVSFAVGYAIGGVAIISAVCFGLNADKKLTDPAPKSARQLYCRLYCP
ncbi:hypothetical protein OAI26_06395 [Sulfitobacter sp.]|nr:hypothetical protein [Sulfitobacter sp.]